ncbi:ABC transporter ATP-binding protein [Acetohalobium arabaticum]|uniref:ABC transporter related protein n=1 Tax=Acetohalobium arabaticum (strain ATCC 49924 / DSM 5501 / Z-7288) TaxID=574087 RepID=D9QVF1_ACEAZ|nr:ABC transporter ATP-binding protein [Acetohalobium arabaticum]ADL12210.1 ABC transporter related protein [Acetohalobium arabaticum DSM 5501]
MSDEEDDFQLSELNWKLFRFLFSYLKPYSKRLLLASIAMLMVTVTTLAGPYLSKLAVDDYIMVGDLAGLNRIFILMIISYGVLWFSSYWQRYLASWVGQQIVGKIRKDFYSKLQRLSIDFFYQQRKGDIISRLTHDVNALSDLLTTGFINLLNDFFTLSGIVVIMLLLNLKLALVSFITIPVILFVVSYLGKKMRRAYRDVRQKLAQLNADVEESISNIRIVQALNREAVNTGEFKKLSWKNLKANLKAVSILAVLFPTISLSKVLGEVLVLWYGGWGVVKGSITLGVVVAFLGYVRRFFAPLANLSQVYNTYQSAGAALERIYEYILLEPEIKEPAEPLVPEGGFSGEIDFVDVDFAYDQEPVIKGFNLHLDSGDNFALVGKTGAGKTTVINLLTRLYDVDSGEILLDGIDLRKISFESLREVIGVVSQNVFLFNTSIKENIKYGNPKVTEKEVIKAAQKVHAHDFITGLPEGYETEVGEKGVKLSGGQKQLISFARTLLADPQILILDEATSSVDAYTEMLIQQALDELLAGRTAIMIAHRFSTLKKAEKIGVLEEGRLTSVGSHQEVLEENSTYQELYQKQLIK